MGVVAENLRRGDEVKMISSGELILRLVVAGVLGALVGLERERLEWAAGMRTHALVSLGSALFMVVSIFGFMDILDERHVILDPSRVAAQVASGIGFIGAGTIIFRREIVKGLTTAASIWAVAAVGLAVGGGMFLAAVSATLLSLALLVLGKGGREEELVSLVEGLRSVSGVREVNSTLTNGSGETSP
jgi:putative Mg2+ transporter-C (MgtC) family protein